MVSRTISCLKQVARIPLTTLVNTWFKSPVDVYPPGRSLSLLLAGSRLVEVNIVKAFTPFTSSVALLVEAQASGRNIGLPDRFVLKLADRRVDEKWNIEIEKDYQLNMSQRGISFGLDDVDDDKYIGDDRIYLPWINHFILWKVYNDSHIAEREAYGRLKEAQASGLIPRFFGTAKIDMMPTALHPSLQHINGLLLEYIPGRTMARFRPGVNITFEEAEIVSQRVLELGRRLRRFGVTHGDVHVGNIILREENNFPVLIDWGCARPIAADLPLPERWKNHHVRTDFHTDIRHLLRTGAYYEGPNDDAVHPTITAGGIWHRFRTPLTDEEQEAQGQEFSYKSVNASIERLPAEEKALFYDEDKSVDARYGLRFKVKKGMKTREWDDPCPMD